ncbi:MAG: hypothetical protein INR62_03895 [Rhodospirillales bacterium]|nr:hypothetical protein [Acetobacter sp.]
MHPAAKTDPNRPAALLQLAAFLDARREPLMEAWKAALRQNSLSGRVPSMDDTGLADHLPHLLNDLGSV